MSAPLSEQQLAERCVCDATSVTDRMAAEHAVWCPSRKPTPERLAEIKAGTGRPLMDGELEWLRGDAGRNELHVIGARGGHWPLTDDLPGAVLDLARKLGAMVAEFDRTRVALAQSENDLTGARLSLWEEDQDTRALREERHSTNEALHDAVKDCRAKDERIAELEAALSTATDQVAGQDSEIGDWSAQVAALEARLHQVGSATTYRLESGKKFVYVEDIADAVFGRPTAGGAA